MKRFFVLIFTLLLLVITGNTLDVYAASDVPEVEVTIHIDGYPVEGTIIGDSSVNVYEAGSFDTAIDTVDPGTVVSLTAQYAYADGSNYFNIKYTRDDVEYYGLVDFYSVEPIGAVITPAPVVDVEYNDNFFEAFKEFIEGMKSFFTGIGDILHSLFPFFTTKEIAFVISFILVFLGLLVYLLFRKVTV